MTSVPKQRPEPKRRRGRPRRFNNPSPDGGAVQVIDRALATLSVIADSDGVTLTELAQQAGLAPSTAHRILASLEAHRFVAHDSERGLWVIGVGAFEVGSSFVRSRRLASIGRLKMHEMMEETGETINLGVEDDGEVIFISQIESHGALRAFFRAGSRAHMHASGVGKALLAQKPDDHVRAILHRRGLTRFTDHTLVTAADLFHNLAEIRVRGWSVDNEERTLGMRCVAAPIFNEYCEAIAGVSLSGPTVRVTPERAAELGPFVKRAAAEITASIGGVSPNR